MSLTKISLINPVFGEKLSFDASGMLSGGVGSSATGAKVSLGRAPLN